MVMIHVSCGMFVGPSKWHGTEVYEPDECGYEDILELDDEDFEDNGFPEMSCPLCQQMLEDDSHFEVML